MCMKNIFIIFAILLATSVSAQTFTPVDSVKQISDTEFVAYINEQTTSISAKEFVEFKQKQHFQVVFTGDKSFNIFIAEDEFVDEYLSVTNIGLSGDTVVVIFDNNTAYKTLDNSWLETNGMTVRHIAISSSKRIFERYLTVDEKGKNEFLSKQLKSGDIAMIPEKPEVFKKRISSKPLSKPTIDVEEKMDSTQTDVTAKGFNVNNFRLVQK